MKHSLSIATSLILGLALTLTACGKDKKPAAEPMKTEPAAAAKTEPAATPPAATAPAAPADPAKPEDKKDDKGGW